MEQKNIIKQENDIIKVVTTIVALRPILSPIQPNSTAPIGLKTKLEQMAKAERILLLLS